MKTKQEKRDITTIVVIAVVLLATTIFGLIFIMNNEDGIKGAWITLHKTKVKLEIPKKPSGKIGAFTKLNKKLQADIDKVGKEEAELEIEVKKFRKASEGFGKMSGGLLNRSEDRIKLMKQFAEDGELLND